MVETFDALLVTETVALKAPAALGVNVRLIVEFWPATIVVGRLGPLREKYRLEIATLLIVTEAVPALETVAVSVLLVLSVTVPKSRLAVPRTKTPDCCC